MNASKKHCIVIGAGIVGSSCAWHLVKRGLKVTLIDQLLPGQSTSYGNAGCISSSHVVPFSHPGIWKKIPRWLFDELGPLTIRWQHLPGLLPWMWKFWRSGTRQGMMRSASAQAQLMHRVSEDYAEALQETGLVHLVESRGCIGVYDSRDDFEEHRWELEIEDELGFEWEYLSPSELRIMVPDLKLDGGVAIFHPSWQHTLNPGRLTECIAEAAFSAGASWLQDKVSRVEASDLGVRVNTESGQELQAGHLVIAAGAWSNALARQLDYTVPLAPKRGYHSMIAKPGLDLEYPIISKSRFFVMTPMEEGLRIAGTAEFAALDAEPDYRRARVLMQQAKHYLPGLRDDGVSEWMGQRPMMADSLPVISPSPSRTRVFYAFGHGHYGLTQGPTTGRIIADLVNNSEPDIDLSPYRFDRFRNR